MLAISHIVFYYEHAGPSLLPRGLWVKTSQRAIATRSEGVARAMIGSQKLSSRRTIPKLWMSRLGRKWGKCDCELCERTSEKVGYYFLNYEL